MALSFSSSFGCLARVFSRAFPPRLLAITLVSFFPFLSLLCSPLPVPSHELCTWLGAQASAFPAPVLISLCANGVVSSRDTCAVKQTSSGLINNLHAELSRLPRRGDDFGA